MRVLPSKPPEPVAIRHVIASQVVETVRHPDGWWLYRCPELLPVNVRHWRGRFESEQAAIADLIEKTRIPRVTREQLEMLKRNDYYAVINGKELILCLDRLTGATVLTRFDLIPDKPD